MDTNSKSIGEKVFSEMKEKILLLELKPGQSVSEQYISNLFNVSRTPVKNAFIKLEVQNFLEVRPQVGTFISKINSDELVKMMKVRMILELHIINDVRDNITPADIKRLERNLERQQQLMNKPETLENSIKFFRLDNEFHGLIFEVANNRDLWNYIQSDANHLNRHRLLSMTIEGRQNMNKRIEEHHQILAKILNSDSDLHAEYQEHIFGQFYEILEQLKIQNPTYFE